MAFQVVEILSSESEKILAKVNHEHNEVTAILPNKSKEDIVIGKLFRAETGYEGTLNWKTIPDFDDARSGIWQENDGIHLLGRVHSIVDFGDGVTTIDVYMQNGPELFTINLEAINDETPEGNDGLEITVSQLYFLPNDP